ncbi:MAG: hypothetical protein QOI49_2083 [Verrucomicrobiota bacterium]|jgi:hypothetical protein
MRLISQKSPTPRLLSTVVPEVRERPPERTTTKSRLKGVSLFSGNGRAIFFGIVLGVILLSTISVVYIRRQAARRHAEEERQLLAVSTHSISPPEPIIVKISADLIRVTAISLGHPRLAIINGQRVGEGEYIMIHTPAASIAVSLRVLKIADGNIELSDGTQVIKARLELLPTSKPKS